MNASELPDETVVYVPEFGETTAGELRSTVQALDGEMDATVRMWLWICTRSPKAEPWRTGRIRVDGKEYPASVFTSERFLPISTLNGMFDGVDFSDPCAVTERVNELQKGPLPG